VDNVNIMFLEQLVKGLVTPLMYARDAKELYGSRASTKFERYIPTNSSGEGIVEDQFLLVWIL